MFPQPLRVTVITNMNEQQLVLVLVIFQNILYQHVVILSPSPPSEILTVNLDVRIIPKYLFYAFSLFGDVEMTGEKKGWQSLNR
jgi:hypothetical protein